jgi:hypothetical protein
MSTSGEYEPRLSESPGVKPAEVLPPLAPPRVAPPISPPTMPGALLTTPAKPQWPNVIGIIGIVVALLSGINGLWHLATPLSTYYMGRLARGDPSSDEMFSAMAEMSWYYYVAGAAKLVMSAWLIASSIGLMKRKRWSPLSMSAWGWGACVVAIGVAIGAGWIQMHAMSTAMASAGTGARGGPPPALMNTMGVVMGVFTGVFSAVFGMAFPVFVMIWMGRKKVREYVATWGVG